MNVLIKAIHGCNILLDRIRGSLGRFFQQQPDGAGAGGLFPSVWSASQAKGRNDEPSLSALNKMPVPTVSVQLQEARDCEYIGLPAVSVVCCDGNYKYGVTVGYGPPAKGLARLLCMMGSS